MAPGVALFGDGRVEPRDQRQVEQPPYNLDNCSVGGSVSVPPEKNLYPACLVLGRLDLGNNCYLSTTGGQLE